MPSVYHSISARGPLTYSIESTSNVQLTITGRDLINVAGLQFQITYLPEYGEVIGVAFHPSLEDENIDMPEMGYSEHVDSELLKVVLVSPLPLPETPGLLNLEFSVPGDDCIEKYMRVGEVRAFNTLGTELSYDDPRKAPKLSMTGDVNQDGYVNTKDLREVSDKLGESDPDLNGDGRVNILDLVIVGKNFGDTCGLSTSRPN